MLLLLFVAICCTILTLESRSSGTYQEASTEEKSASRKHLRTKVTPHFDLTYSKNGGNLGLVSKR